MNKKEKDLLFESIKQYEEAKTTDDKERTWIDTDTKFAIDFEGCQWPKDIREQRESENPPRPCIVNNKIPEKIDQVDGEFRQLRPSVKVRPVDSKADPLIAEIYGGIIRHIEYDSTARSAYNTSHTSVLYGGRGAWRIDLEDDEFDPFLRNIKINRIPDVLSVVFDQYCKKQDRSDARFVFLTEKLPKAVFETKYPGVPDIPWNDDEKTWNAWLHGESITVAEKWWIEKEPVEYLQIMGWDKQMHVERVSDLKPEQLASLEDPNDSELGTIKKRKTVQEDRVKWAKMTAGAIIKDPDTGKMINDWPGKYIPIILQFGKEIWIEGQAKSRGMVRFGRSPQEIFNFFTTQDVITNSLSPLPPWIVTPAMLKDHTTSWDQAHIKAFPYLYVNADPQMPQGPQKNQPAQMSPATAQIKAQMEHDIQSGMGIYAAKVGDAGAETSGKAILARQKQGDIGAYTYTDNFETAYIHSMKIIIDLIPYAYDSERVLRIRGEDDVESTVPINALPDQPLMEQFSDKQMKTFGQPKQDVTGFINDLTVGKYDIVATIGPSYSTQREESTAILRELIAEIPGIGEAGADIIVRSIDFKEANQLADRLKKRMQAAGVIEPDDDEEQEITQQMVEQAVQEAVKQAIQEYMQSQEGQKLQAEVQTKQTGLEIEKTRLEQQREQTQQYQLKVKSEDLKAETQARKVETEEIKKDAAAFKLKMERILGEIKITIEEKKAKEPESEEK